MSETKRRQVWLWAYHNNKPAVFVGPRSALFLPLNNLGLIIIDEAHDNSYKQLQSPKYNALHVAGKLAALNDAALVHSTATPNIDDYEIAKAHHFSILTMSKTAAGSQKGIVYVVDIRDRDKFVKSPYLSSELIDASIQALARKEQVMLYLNRRGSARLIQCAKCGWQAACPNCDLPLVYHHDKYLASCHTCSYNEKIISQCPVCHSTDILFKVIGTKSLLEHTAQLFPKAKIMRFDADSAKDAKYHESIDIIKNGEVDIIVGTQLITKGIDLPRLSVVGVINADSSLNLPDYKAEETTFQQLYQVTGRAIRGHIKSQVFIQTRLPEHPVIKAVRDRSWKDFYEYELLKRVAFSYPPMVHLAILKVAKKTPFLARKKSLAIYQQLSRLKGIQLLGPSPSFYEKSLRGYSWQIVIKSKKRSALVEIAKQLPDDWIVDIDPISTL
jgi:primosomal protein N' (replication factor Y)